MALQILVPRDGGSAPFPAIDDAARVTGRVFA